MRTAVEDVLTARQRQIVVAGVPPDAGPCSEDFHGLLAAVAGAADGTVDDR